MNRRHALWLGAMITTVGLLVAAGSSLRAAPTVDAASKAGDRRAVSSRAEGSLARRSEAVRSARAVAPRAGVGTALAPREDRPEEGPEVDLELDLEDPPDDSLQTALRLSAAIARQPTDANYLADVRGRTERFLAVQARAGNQLTDIACGTSLCRLSVRSDDVNAKAQVLTAVAELLPPRGEGFAHVQGPNDLQFEIFLGASDTPLPE